MTTTSERVEPALNLQFLSHGTLETKDLDFAERFYREFLGLNVIRMSNIALCIRLGGDHTIVVVKTNKRSEMSLMNHNGFDVATPADVDHAYQKVLEQKEKWGIGTVTPPKLQHGSYSFYFWDADANCWEILANPPRGYSSLFDEAYKD